MAESLNKENFEKSVKTKGKVLVDFYSDSCVPCKKLTPILG
nr:thioredoxin family protein [Treponema sp.]